MRAALNVTAGGCQQCCGNVTYARLVASQGKEGVRPMKVPCGAPAAELATATHLLH